MSARIGLLSIIVTFIYPTYDVIIGGGKNMKRNIERKYIWNFLKAAVIIGVTLVLLMPGLSTFANYNKTVKVQASVNTIIASTSYDIIFVDAITIFTIENPPVDFEVVDADPFDGFGDNGPYSTFNDALLGTLGECRSMAEFDISPFSIPPGEFISMATFEVIITEIDIFGLGVDGETPESLAVDGYVGNGIEELSDFEAGDGNVLDSVDTPDPQIGQVLSFNVTSFVTDLVNAQEQYVGLTIRAETFGGLWVTEGDVFPKLTIEIENQPPHNPSTPSGSTILNIDESGTYSTNATDPDGDQVQYRFDWDANESHDYSGWTDFVPSGTTVSMNHSWSNGGSYVVKAQARDTYNETSGWSNGLSVYVNSPPNSPSDPEPEDGATDVDVNADLSWSCSDPDDDNLTYDVYFEAYDSTPDELVSNNQTESWFDPGTMDYNTDYYWQIVAWDENGQTTEGPVWDFITSSEPNDPPNPPSNPDPADEATDVSIDADLSWDCNDPDGDDIFYDVYLEANDTTPDILVADDYTATTFDPGTLEYGTTYYWKIIAIDEHSASTIGPIWQFTTEKNIPPDMPSIDGPDRGKPETLLEYGFTSVDPDGHDIAEYIVNWGDETEENIKGPFESGEEVTGSHSWTSQETFTIKAKSKDVYGAESEWAEFVVEIPRNKPFSFNYKLLGWFLDRFPMLERLLG